MKAVIVFGMLVKVISGFYTGCTGIVVQYYPVTHKPYGVELTCKMGNGRIERTAGLFDAEELKENKP